MCGIPFEGEDAIFNEDDPNEDNFDVFDIDINDLRNELTPQPPPLPELSDEQRAHLIEASANALIGIRQTVADGQAKQAEKMMTRSNRYLGECEIGEYVTLPIPQVDRSVSSAPNLICRIVDIDYIHNMHELACEAGVLNIMFARNCFERLKSKDLPNVHINCEKAISVREAASKIDIGGGQGMLKYN